MGGAGGGTAPAIITGVRYLVVGLGNIGSRRRALLGERCVATADPFNREADYRSARDVPLDLFDAAVLAIPNDAKMELVRYLVENGKHVLVEKPLPLPDDEEGVRLLHQTVRERGIIVYTAYNHRFEPLVVRFRDHVRAGVLGEIYHGRLFYGNGTVQHVKGSWRDKGLSVVQREELDQSPDRALLISGDGRVTYEMTYHAWRNTFAMELYGSKGSIHLFGLRKWGGSELIVRERVLPSGMPRETRETDQGEDVTWALEMDHFERLCASGQTDWLADWWIAETVRRVEKPAVRPIMPTSRRDLAAMNERVARQAGDEERPWPTT
jgi:scyllo-inositol 2-dehydrogenase (NADP+)